MLKRFHNWLLDWKPIHLCWWFEKHGRPVPRYLIGGGGSPPSVTTNAATSVGGTSATLNGEITSDGGRTLDAAGFTLSSTDSTPTLGEGGVTDVSHSTPAVEVYSEPSGTLSSGTQYWYQAYATNAKGTSYGGVQTFTTLENYTIASNDISLALTEDNTTITQNHVIASVDTTLALTEDVGTIDASPDLVGTYEDKATLPTTDAALANTMTAPEKGYVELDDNVYFDLEGSDYLIKNFLYDHTNNTDEITVTAKVKSALAPTSSTVYLQIYNYNTPAWETLDYRPFTIDTYAISNNDTDYLIQAGASNGYQGQSFTGDGKELTSVTVSMKNTTGATGTATAYLFAHSGTFGTSSVGTGAALATSATVDLTTIGTSYEDVTFTFSGFTPTDGTYYVCAIGTSALGAAIYVGGDSSSPSHGGNKCVFSITGDSWTAQSGVDLGFVLTSDYAADTEFTLTGSKTTSLSNYYTTGDKVLARVYQQVV